MSKKITKFEPQARPAEGKVTFTIRNDELKAAMEGMAALLPERMSAHLAMKLRRMLRAAAPVAKDMEDERQKLLKQHA